MNKYLKANQALWDEWTGINYRSEFYKVAGFKAGLNRLRPYEMTEVGPVAGKHLLHLQCGSPGGRAATADAALRSRIS
jgi:hypothetical protein